MQDNSDVFTINTVLNHVFHNYQISFTGTNYEKYKNILHTMYKTNPKIFINDKKISFIPYNNWKFSKVLIPRFIERTEHERKPSCTFYTMNINNKFDNLPADICSLICIELNLPSL